MAGTIPVMEFSGGLHDAGKRKWKLEPHIKKRERNAVRLLDGPVAKTGSKD